MCNHSLMTYDRSTRILHFGIVITILLQLLGEQFIGLPEPGQVRQPFDTLFIGIHEGIGSIALVLVCAYLVITLDQAAGRTKLFPWATKDGRASVWSEICRDVPGWLHGQIPLPRTGNQISGSVHGAGIILASILGLSGTLLFIGMGPHGEMTPDIKAVWKAHSIMATMMWIFIIGHGGMAIAHEAMGHGIIRAMFRLGKDCD